MDSKNLRGCALFSSIAIGFSQLDPLSFFLLFAGSVVGLIFGCVPGLSGSIALTLAIPLTFTMTSIQAFASFMGIFVGGCSGGLISAILIGVPGTPSSLTTVFDGYPMAQKGQPGKALGVAIFCSFLGSLFGFLALFWIAEPLSRIAIKFGPIELFSINLFAISLVSVLAGKDLLKGWVVALIGILLGMVGMSEVDGIQRMTLGIGKLNSGISATPAMVGLFVIGSLFSASLADKGYVDTSKIMDYRIHGLGFSLKEAKEQGLNFLRSALIGLGIGILPGIGGVTSNLVAYTVAKSSSKHPELFGTGHIGGVVASETANNASVGGAMIPFLALGIPGDGFTALLMGGLTLHGFIAGPILFTANSHFVYAIFACLLLSAVITVLVEYTGLPLLVKSLKVPKHILMPIIMVMIMVGCISVNNRIFECWIMLFFGIISYILRKYKFSITPVVLGFMLGPQIEVGLRRGLMIARNDVSVFFTNPVSLTFILLAVLGTLFLLRQNNRNEARLRAHAAKSGTILEEDVDD